MSMNIGNNPMAYLKKYAKDNNMDVKDAMGALQSQYGMPQQQLQSTSIFNMAGKDQGGISGMEKMMGNPNMMPGMNEMPGMNRMLGMPGMPGMQGMNEMQEPGQGGFMQKIMNFFKGGPQEGNMQMPPMVDMMDGLEKSDNSKMMKPEMQGQQGQNGQQDPDAYAQQYADANGITLEEAKAQLKAKYGNPQQPQQ